MPMKDSLDAVLKTAVNSGEVPGVIAMVTDRNGTLYEGAFGERVVGRGQPMTMDTVGLIASMTKAITSTAVMQLVERKELDLESPASKWLPALAEIQVLEGFGNDGQPVLRKPNRPITALDLLTHTAGFSYEFLSTDLQRYLEVTETPSVFSCTQASINLPLISDPGQKWGYGINTDWAGRLVEAVSGMRLGEYLAYNVLHPLDMNDTAFTMRPDMRERLAKIHARQPDGSLSAIDLEMPPSPELDMGGHGLYSTVSDYVKFLRMILNRGQAGANQVLRPDTIDQMTKNQIGELCVPDVVSVDKRLSNDMLMPPGISHNWGLGFLINEQPWPTGRSSGSLMWAGLTNCYYWIDPSDGIGGVLMTQILPFADIKALPLFLRYEATAYQQSREL